MAVSFENESAQHKNGNVKGRRDEWEPAQLVLHRGTPCHRQLWLHSAEKLMPISPNKSDTAAGEAIAARRLQLKWARRHSQRCCVPGSMSTPGRLRPVKGRHMLSTYILSLSVGGCACIKERLSWRFWCFYLRRTAGGFVRHSALLFCRVQKRQIRRVRLFG